MHSVRVLNVATPNILKEEIVLVYLLYFLVVIDNILSDRTI